MEFPLLDPRNEPVILPALEQTPLPHLRIYNGFGCSYCSVVSQAVDKMRSHYNNAHAPERRGRGGRKCSGSRAVREQLEREHFGDKPPWEAVKFQRFFRSGPGSSGFRISQPEEQPSDTSSIQTKTGTQRTERSNSVTNDVFETLDALELEHAQGESMFQHAPTKTQVSPWLERTQWPSFLNGVSLHEAARLMRLPDKTEPVLSEVVLSIDRLVEAAYTSVRQDKINFFAQKCISSFLPNKKAYSQPLMVKLQKSTYHRYKDLWKRLICFTYRSSNVNEVPRLRHRLTSRQTALLDELLAVARELVDRRLDGGAYPNEAAAPYLTQRIDNLCLEFCIAALDHQLKGDIFESVVLAFLAVSGIDTAKSIFFEAPNHTSKLSGFIKIAQMLVLEKAVREVESGMVENALDPLDEMRERFMTINNCTPFSWAVSTRSFGKKIRDSVTSLGYIQWSEDEQTVFYKDVELRIDAFRKFIALQMKQAQGLLANLFMLDPEENREDVIPAISLYRIRDNPTVTEPGWNFLQDDRNNAILPCKRRWLLGRVLRIDKLREEFTYPNHLKKLVWDKQAVRKYYKRVDMFLERPLLLIHIVSGQPARGTEIIGLQHTNSTFHRNVFIEDGLVALVTSYHKGYTCTGSTKIIHRYLPKELSELVVYYLWIIHPFLRELDLLIPGSKPLGSSFLWPDGEGSWNSQRLSTILKRETINAFKAPMTIPIYRHVAIAISRRHLNGGGFKRDYDIRDRVGDLQTTHTSWTAGRLYARGLEEVPGYVEARRAGFRAVSREWHNFLGFASTLNSRKRSPEGDPNQFNSKRRRVVENCWDF
jgi:hypothetical protein